MLIKNWLFTVNLIIFLRERFIYYRYLVKKDKTNMNTNQVRPHTLPHLNLTVNLWDGHFYAHFSVMRQCTQRGHLTTPGQVSQLPNPALWASKDASFSPLGCEAPGGVTTSKIFNKNVPSQEASHCFFGREGGLHGLFNCAKIYIVLKFPLYIKWYDSILVITNDNITYLHLKQERSYFTRLLGRMSERMLLQWIIIH